MCQVLTHCGFSGVSTDGNCAYVHWGSFTSNSRSVRRAIWFTWFSRSVYNTWQSQAVTHPIMNRARRCLTSVIEPITMSERRIPYITNLSKYLAIAINNDCSTTVGRHTWDRSANQTTTGRMFEDFWQMFAKASISPGLRPIGDWDEWKFCFQSLFNLKQIDKKSESVSHS